MWVEIGAGMEGTLEEEADNRVLVSQFLFWGWQRAEAGGFNLMDLVAAIF